MSGVQWRSDLAPVMVVGHCYPGVEPPLVVGDHVQCCRTPRSQPAIRTADDVGQCRNFHSVRANDGSRSLASAIHTGSCWVGTNSSVA